MSSSSNLSEEKEDLGVLLFALDNEVLDYLQLARECTRRIHRYWGNHIRVSVVIDKDKEVKFDKREFDHLIRVDTSQLPSNKKMFHDFEANASFRNGNRVQALELTPYRWTILMDVDLMVQTDDIIRLYDRSGLKIVRNSYSVFDYHPLSTDMQVLSRMSGIHMYWATVVCFDRENEEAKTFFKEWKKALQMYRTYSTLFGFAQTPTRNDFAVSVAVYRLLDHVYRDTHLDLPYDLPALMPQSEVYKMEDQHMLVRNHEGGTTAVYSDLHVMNKKSILSCLHQLES